VDIEVFVVKFVIVGCSSDVAFLEEVDVEFLA
jgi:hypothetical protein